MERMPKGEMPVERITRNCAGMNEKLADLLLDPDAAPTKVRLHVAQCDRCSTELEELRATLAVLDSWRAEEPNPYFLTRLDARLREEMQAAQAENWFIRLRNRWAYGPATHVRPLAAMALTVLLLVGGGAYLGITDWDQIASPSGHAAVVHDLQTMDNNAQLLDQLEEISSSNDN
jgi:hypothetical protein